MSRSVDVQKQFENTAVSMADLPIYNSQLRVETVGFHPYQDAEIGVLVTPWCMNLMLLPAESVEDAEAEGRIGRKKLVALPSGQYEFISGWSETLGEFYSCSLFSPMFDFASHEAAVDTAAEVIKAVFEAENYAPTDRQIAEQAKKEEQGDSKARRKMVERKKPAELSRRGFMTGGLVREQHKARP